MEIRRISDVNSCRNLWHQFVHKENVSDLWEFRECFHRHYNNRPYFIVLEERSDIIGMLPLCYLQKEDLYVFFPGETWKRKTWLERTPIFCKNEELIEDLVSGCPGNAYLRYVEFDTPPSSGRFEIDEIGYTLSPEQMNYDISFYFERFSRKRLKSIRKDISSLIDRGAEFSINRVNDFSKMIDWNIERYGTDSYYHDPRFRESFRDIMQFCQKMGALRMVSLDIQGETAAVDLGVVYNGKYTLFAGGTNSKFPSVSKAINMYHIETAFSHKFSAIDFLCGDFTWKKLWHLDAKPLFKFAPSEEWKREQDTTVSLPEDTLNSLISHPQSLSNAPNGRL